MLIDHDTKIVLLRNALKLSKISLLDIKTNPIHVLRPTIFGLKHLFSLYFGLIIKKDHILLVSIIVLFVELHCIYNFVGRMVQGAGYLAEKAKHESSALAESMIAQETGILSTTTTMAPTTTLSIAEYNLKQPQLEADKTKVNFSGSWLSSKLLCILLYYWSVFIPT